MHYLPQWLKSTFFEKNIKWRVPKALKGTRKVKNFFPKTLILVFEVIMQPRKHTFDIGFFCDLAHREVYWPLSFPYQKNDFIQD